MKTNYFKCKLCQNKIKIINGYISKCNACNLNYYISTNNISGYLYFKDYNVIMDWTRKQFTVYNGNEDLIVLNYIPKNLTHLNIQDKINLLLTFA